MKKLLFLLLIIFLIPINVNANSTKLSNILDKFDEKSFLTIDDIEIQINELNEIVNYLYENNIIDKSNSKETNLNNIYSYIRNNVKYENGDNNAYSVFKNNKAICQGYANLFKLLCYIIDIPCIIINGDTTFGAHAWNIIYLNKWLQVDITNGVSWEEKEQERFDALYFPQYLSLPLFEENNIKYYYANGLTVDYTNSSLNKVIIPDSINGLVIDSLCAPMKCNKNEFVKEIELSKNIKYIDKSFFDNYLVLEKITSSGEHNIDSGVLYLNSNIIIPKGIKELTINNIDSLEKNMIYGLDYLTKLIILDVKHIKSFSVENCKNLKEIIISDFVTQIDDNAFSCDDILINSNNKVAIEYAINNNINYKTNSNKYPIIAISAVAIIIVSVIIYKYMMKGKVTNE